MNEQRTQKQKIGYLGEDIACVFLKKQGFRVKERNYWKKWGEIDIIAEKSKKIYFIEVKSVSRENLQKLSHETDAYRAEDNIHPKKLQRLTRTIQSYLLEKGVDGDPWQLDAVTVEIDIPRKQARVRKIEDIIL